MNERQLIARVLRGDAAAERELYDAHVHRVYRLALRMTGDETMAEDLTQDTFIRAFDRLPNFRGNCAFSTWLWAVASSVIRNGLRKVKLQRQRERAVEDLESVAGAAPDTDRELVGLLEAAVARLPEDARRVFLMYEVEGLSHREMARLLGAPEGTTKVRLFRARRKLRGLLERLGLDPGLEAGR